MCNLYMTSLNALMAKIYNDKLNAIAGVCQCYNMRNISKNYSNCSVAKLVVLLLCSYSINVWRGHVNSLNFTGSSL